MALPNQILIVIADEKERSALAGAFRSAGYKADAVADYSQARKRLGSTQFDLIATEVNPAPAGIDFITRVRASAQSAGMLILVIADWGAGEATMALAQGANGYEPKPFDAARVLASAARLLSLKTVEAK